MENQLTSIVFSFTILSLTLLEKKRLNSLITPFTVCAWPFVIISIFANFILIYFGFPAITVRVHYFLLANLVIIWIFGFFLYFFLFNKPIRESEINFDEIFVKFRDYQIYILVISWILALIILYRAKSLVSQHGGWTYMGSQEYEDTVITGWVAHLVQMAKVCFLFIVFGFKSSKNKFFALITLIILGLTIAIIQVKYHLVWLLIILFFFRNVLKPPKFQLKNFIKLSLILFTIMSSFWIFLTIAWGTFGFSNIGVWDFVLGHFVNYLVSAPMVLDHWLSFGDIKPQWTLLTVFFNFFNVISGHPERLISKDYVSHGFFATAPGLYSNVGTAFGVYYFIGGYLFSFFMSALMATISYFFYFSSLKTRHPILIYLNLIFLTLGILSFFGQYLTLLPIYELTSFYIILFIILNLFNKVKKI